MNTIEAIRLTGTAEKSSPSARALTRVILCRAAGGWIDSGAPFCAERRTAMSRQEVARTTSLRASHVQRGRVVAADEPAELSGGFHPIEMNRHGVQFPDRFPFDGIVLIGLGRNPARTSYLLYPDMPVPQFTADVVGKYLLSLMAFDGLIWSDPDLVEITVVAWLTSDSGRYSSTGFHNPDITEYTATVGSTRSFFVFDLTSLTGPRRMISATLKLDTGGVTGGAFGGITYTLYDVSTPIPTLVAGGNGLTAIYDDLGSGEPYSTAVDIAPEEAGSVKSIPLLAAGLAALESAKGGLIAIGGSPTGLGGNFAFDGTDVSGATLEMKMQSPPVPTVSRGGLVVLVALLAGSFLLVLRSSRVNSC